MNLRSIILSACLLNNVAYSIDEAYEAYKAHPYFSFCQLAAKDDKTFDNFKNHPDYQDFVETVTQYQGSQYLDVIKERYPILLNQIDKLKGNDKIGNPNTYNYPLVGQISPTTLRYIKVAGDLKKEFGDLSQMHIVEIGGGYGGQCKVLSDLFGFASYTLIDLPGCNQLSKKYLDKLGVKNVKWIDYDKVPNGLNFDLLISNYAFSELDKKEQYKYVEKVITPAKRGYMTCNFVVPISIPAKDLEALLSKLHRNVKVTQEDPLTYVNNLLFVWDDA